MYIYLTTSEFEFDSAHYLRNYKGKCANLHGHNWKFNVTISGEVNPKTGMLMDFKELKTIVEEKITGKYDHKCLNDVVAFNPTAENLAKEIFWEISAELPSNIELVKVRLYEKYPTPYVEYYGD